MASPTVMAVVSADDREVLKNALRGSSWTMEVTDNLQEALQRTRSGAIGVAICDSVLPDGHSWKDLLNEFHAVPDEPALIIAAREADSRLWAEVINLGGCDVVVKPFHRDELLHVLNSAWLVFSEAMSESRPRSASLRGNRTVLPRR
jgi:DNA-binding NtrC family response regulator